MSKTVTIKGHVWDYHFGTLDEDYETAGRLSVMSAGPESAGNEYRSYVGPIEVQYTVPDSYNPTRESLAALEAEKAKVRAAYLARVREIEDRISKLQALTNEVEA